MIATTVPTRVKAAWARLVRRPWAYFGLSSRAECRHRQASGHQSAFRTEHDTASDRTPLVRMLPSVIAGPASRHGGFR
jgi:hypothetical protein